MGVFVIEDFCNAEFNGNIVCRFIFGDLLVMLISGIWRQNLIMSMTDKTWIDLRKHVRRTVVFPAFFVGVQGIHNLDNSYPV
jgi:hypothetical protein